MRGCIGDEIDSLLTVFNQEIAEKVKEIKETNNYKIPEDVAEITKYIDLTCLTVYDNPTKIVNICSKGVGPFGPQSYHVAGICCFSRFAEPLVKFFSSHDCSEKMKTAVVCGGFPHAQVPLRVKEIEFKDAVEQGVSEIDLVIPRGLVFANLWDELFDELTFLRKACPRVTLKVIISTGELIDGDLIQKAAAVSILAGCDFVKLCTGFGSDLATYEAGIHVAAVIKKYYEKTGKKIGMKTSGGIRTVEQAFQWMTLVKRELGDSWLTPKLFRIGASSLLDDVIKVIG